MVRIRILLGIGFMLVGALAYALPPVLVEYRLLPSLVGVFVSLWSLVVLRYEPARQPTTLLTYFSAFLLIVYSLGELFPETGGSWPRDWVVNGSVFIFACILMVTVQQEIRNSQI